MTQAMTPDLTAIKGRQQQTWSAGNYGMIGARLLLISERLCEAVDVRAGERVLDVATGSGNTALAAARCGAQVTGIDYVPSLLEQGRTRAAAEGLDVAFAEGDAEQVPYPDGSFDVVLSTLGAMFAPDQERTAGEILRVCRPGGRIGLANWTPEGFIGQLFKVTGGHVPPPAGLKPPTLWGTEARLRELFGGAVGELSATRRTWSWRFPSADAWIAFMRTYYGPTLKAFEALDADGQARYEADLAALTDRFNRSGDGTIVMPSEYLEVVATRR